MSEEKKPDNKLFAALAVGAAIGAGIALLLSPRRGRELRAQIRESGISLKERVQKQLTGFETRSSIVEQARPLLTAKGEESDYDVIVVGGGHNGLVCAAYLAKAGLNVLVLERRGIVGGVAVTEELIPQYHCSSLTDDSGSLSPEIVSELDLAIHGLKFINIDPLIFSPMADGTNLTIWTEVNRTVDEISKFSQADAAIYPSFIKQMSKHSQVVSGLNLMTPPDLPYVGIGDMLELRNAAGLMRGLAWNDIAHSLRVLPMPVSDLLNEWFESDMVKGAIAASALNNISLGPREAGTAFMLLHNWSNSSNEGFLPNKVAAGGTGALSQVLAQAAVRYGAEIRKNNEVTKIVTQHGQTVGIELNSGEQITAAAVVSAVDMKSTFLKLVDPYYLDRSFVQHVRNIKYRGTMARVHFALDRLPAFSAAKDDASNLLTGTIQIAPSMTYLQQAYDPAKYGSWSPKPYLNIRIPSLADPSLVPAGKHLMSVTAKYMPYSIRDGSWNDQGEMLAQLVIDTISEYAPGFPGCVSDYRVITPLDLETEYCLPEGNLAHGEMTLDRFLWMRPIPGYAQYRAPIDDLYMCSSATHPGGGVTGLNGKNAAREILKDWN